MKNLMTGVAIAALTAGAASAGGIDRSGQFLSPLFQDGGETGAYMQLSFGQVSPEANGNFTLGGNAVGAIGQPLDTYGSASFAYKNELSEALSFAIIVDQPYGVDLDYAGTPIADGFFAQIADNFGAAAAAAAEANGLTPQTRISSNALTSVLRYKFNDNFSVHGGLRSQQMKGTVISGSGFLRASSGRDWGYLAGVAYERPDIAMRVALTYNSAIDHEFTASTLDPATFTLSAPAGTFDLETPESLNLEFQTGVAADTLLFGSVRYVKWDGFNLTAPGNSGPATEYVRFTEDTTTFSIGLGRRLNDNWSIAATYGYEESGNRPGNTLLAPTTGTETFGLAATYTEGAMQLTAGVSMGRLGDQIVPNSGAIPPGAPGAGTPLDATFSGNTVFGAGIRLGYSF